MWKVCSRGHRFFHSSACPVCPKCWKGYYATKKTDLPSVGAPAQRALDREGITRLSQLKKWRKKELAALHGIGPKAVSMLMRALKEKGWTFKS